MSVYEKLKEIRDLTQVDDLSPDVPGRINRLAREALKDVERADAIVLGLIDGAKASMAVDSHDDVKPSMTSGILGPHYDRR